MDGQQQKAASGQTLLSFDDTVERAWQRFNMVSGYIGSHTEVECQVTKGRRTMQKTHIVAVNLPLHHLPVHYQHDAFPKSITFRTHVIPLNF